MKNCLVLILLLAGIGGTAFANQASSENRSATETEKQVPADAQEPDCE